MDELNKILDEVAIVTGDTVSILVENFPLDSRIFLPEEAQRKVLDNDNKIKELAREYSDIYFSLPIDERRKIQHYNIIGTYYQKTFNPKGLVYLDEKGDEYEIREAFSKAEKFGREAIDKMYDASTSKEEIVKQERVLSKCQDVFLKHFWGEGRLKSLDRYRDRVSHGITVENDIVDYTKLIQEAKEISKLYAKAILEGRTDMIDYLQQRFEDMFSKEFLLTEFMPAEVRNSFKDNIHWLKIAAEKNPNKVLNPEPAEVQVKM